jgi:hypothetical protein|tara:strand:+ start:550 stop:735 length:186 start_codon:yes stop_codon:yes gene_type:complete
MTKQEFKSLLDQHDWFFERSDDHAKWKRGVRQRADIMQGIKEIGTDAQYLFDVYRLKKFGL